jgi:pyruvate dehydrogenase E2 component (dihydrolipoamide acetyltransferase)
MAEYAVKLPSLGDDAGDFARVSFVYVSEGDKVEIEADLIEMLTDKATFTVPSPKAGIIKKMVVTEDDMLHVGDTICLLDIIE